MRASDIAIAGATVGADATVATALRAMTEHRLPGLILVDAENRPKRVIPGTQVLRLAIPESYQSDAALARAVDEPHADAFWAEENGRTVVECLSEKKLKPGTVRDDATLLEVATTMAETHSPLIAVVDARGVLTGTITLGRLLRHLTLPDSP